MARPTPAGASDDEAIPRRRRHFSPGPPPTLLARPQRQPPPSLNQVAEQIQDAQLHRDVFPVDRWLGRCLDEALVPRKKHVDYFRAPTFDDFLTPDLVECTVTIAERECIEDDDGIFVNESIFRLNLNVYVPPECGFLCFVAHSPTVTLDKWRGLLDDTNNRPGWLDYHATGTLKFWQPRSVIVDLIGMFRCHSFNASNNPSLQRWVEGVTVTFRLKKRCCEQVRGPNRRRVPCECKRCGGVNHVTQEERRRHLKQEKALMDQVLRDILHQGHHEEAPAPRAHLLTSEQPAGNPHSIPPTTSPINSLAPTTTLPVAAPELVDVLLTTPDNMVPFANEPSPLPAQSSMFGLNMPTAEEVFEPIIDDNWEEPDACDDPEGPLLPQGLINTAASSGSDSIASPSVPANAISPNASATPNASQSAPPLASQGVPAFKLQENSPDPFITPVPPSSEQFTDAPPGIHLLYILVTWLHVQFHLPFRACTALLNVVLLILKSFGIMFATTPVTTLPRIMAKLNVEPVIYLLPVCPNCLEVYPSKKDTPSCCSPVSRKRWITGDL
ncbi:hypothetical protein MD484_g8650, partial [Candolleomyces efflorescens]